MNFLFQKKIAQDFYRKFETKNRDWHSHPVGVLLTLTLKMQQINE